EFRTMLRLVPDREQLSGDDVTRYITVLDDDTLKNALASIGDEFAVDTETTSPLPVAAELVGLSFSSSGDTAYYVPLAHDYPGAPD
ncbi:MAG: hypothetical protein GTO08_04890, partial [Deltaproteobacteria bacterium]|nr:hypothetical protein [Deltaproteobacteria bacterium]